MPTRQAGAEAPGDRADVHVDVIARITAPGRLAPAGMGRPAPASRAPKPAQTRPGHPRGTTRQMPAAGPEITAGTSYPGRAPRGRTRRHGAISQDREHIAYLPPLRHGSVKKQKDEAYPAGLRAGLAITPHPRPARITRPEIPVANRAAMTPARDRVACAGPTGQIVAVHGGIDPFSARPGRRTYTIQQVEGQETYFLFFARITHW